MALLVIWVNYISVIVAKPLLIYLERNVFKQCYVSYYVFFVRFVGFVTSRCCLCILDNFCGSLTCSWIRYTQNGILHMLERNKRIKVRPERFQNCKDQFDIVITCEERVYDQVLEGEDPARSLNPAFHLSH